MELKQKTDNIHYELFQKVMQIKSMLKCLEFSCGYDEELTLYEIMLFAEVLSQKTGEIANIIDKLKYRSEN